MKFKNATTTHAVILGLPFDLLAEFDFIAFDLETREPVLFA